MTGHAFVAGGAGFIGANLVPALRTRGLRVTVADNFSRGDAAFLEAGPGVRVLEADLAEREQAEKALAAAAADAPVTEVWHMAANSDIPAGVADADVDHRDTYLTTFELLRAMKAAGVRVLRFASSSAIYGDLGDARLHEDIGPLLPISNYGAMKLASEAIASAAAEAWLERVDIFRFPNVVGVPATHGVILDFVNKLKSDPSSLEVLGDGTQRKAYLHVSDLVSAMLAVTEANWPRRAWPVNIGAVDEGVTVRWIAEQVVRRVSPAASIRYGQGGRGWVGDVPRFSYSTERLRSIRWAPALNSEAAVARAIDEIARQQQV